MARINITEIRRRQLVDAAVTVMARKGWAETSIDEVTKEAGVSRGLVSYHFKDKNDLLSSVLDRCRDTFNESVARAAAEADPGPARMRRVVRIALNLMRDDPVTYQVFLHFAAAARSQPELGEQIRLLYAEFRRQVAHGIHDGQQRGDYRAELDAEAAATQLCGAIVGVALQWLIDPDGFPFEATARQTEEMILAYLVAVPAPSVGTAAAGGVAAAVEG